MKILKSNYKIFSNFAICPADPPVPKWIEIRNHLTLIWFITAMLSSTCTSFVYFIKYFKVDLEAALYAFSETPASFMVLYTALMAFVLRNDIKQIFDDFQHFYESSKL